MTRVACTIGLLVSLAFLAPRSLTQGTSAATPHDYFNAMIARAEHWKSYSMRNQSQLTTYKSSGSAPQTINYLWPSDPDPHAQDAAKVVIPPFQWYARGSLAVATGTTETVLYLSTWSSEFYSGRAALIDSEAVYITAVDSTAKTLTVNRGAAGTTAASHTSGAGLKLSTNGVPNQVRFPVGATDGASYLFTWDAYWTDSYLSSGLTNHKAFQFSAWTTDAIWLQSDVRYSGEYSTGFTRSTDVASVTMRSMNALGGKTDYSLNTAASVGPGVTKIDPIMPMQAEFIIKPNRWIRFWAKIDMRAADYDLVDYWVADETRGPVQIYKGIAVSNSLVNKFWLEFDTSTDRFVRGNTRDLVTYVRNLAILRNVASADLPGLLQRPIGVGSGPLPPSNVRLLN